MSLAARMAARDLNSACCPMFAISSKTNEVRHNQTCKNWVAPWLRDKKFNKDQTNRS